MRLEQVLFSFIDLDPKITRIVDPNALLIHFDPKLMALLLWAKGLTFLEHSVKGLGSRVEAGRLKKRCVCVSTYIIYMHT